ncbi:hypothetical protein [Blackfly microvirus SF02]|uniref:Uncharacterized protein n=1 Tax=Blackfly microvirus SF02 TaxID=2576452 RepID=A0A4P8PKD8_9VIRU|nr:hypothetical protein [Blackfly microvirus SF02]
MLPCVTGPTQGPPQSNLRSIYPPHARYCPKNPLSEKSKTEPEGGKGDAEPSPKPSNKITKLDLNLDLKKPLPPEGTVGKRRPHICLS